MSTLTAFASVTCPLAVQLNTQMEKSETWLMQVYNEMNQPIVFLNCLRNLHGNQINIHADGTTHTVDSTE